MKEPVEESVEQCILLVESLGQEPASQRLVGIGSAWVLIPLDRLPKTDVLLAGPGRG